MTSRNRIATHDQARYPSLWRGCDGDWSPHLGSTGLILRDWSGFGRHGTLTNTTAELAWGSRVQGSQMLTFDGSNDYVATTWNPTTMRGSAYACSASCWVQQASSGTRQFIYGVGGVPRWYMFIEATNRVVFVGIGSQGLGTATIFPSSGLHHLGFTKVGTTLKVFLDGKLDSTNSYTGDNLVPNLSIPIGAQDTGTAPINGQLGGIRYYNRTLSDSEMHLLGTRIGIAHEMAPRRRSSVQITGNRRRRLLIGAH